MHLTFIIPPITHIVTLIYSPLNLTHALFEGIVWYFGEFYKNFNDNQSWIKTDAICLQFCGSAAGNVCSLVHHFGLDRGISTIAGLAETG